MIQIREVFLIYPGRMKEAVNLAKESRNTAIKNGLTIKILTDLSSEFYSLIFEIEVKSFDDYLVMNKNIHAAHEWKEWYSRFSGCIRKGKRELFSVLE